jgi:transposase
MSEFTMNAVDKPSVDACIDEVKTADFYICFRMRCRAILLKPEGLSSICVGKQTEMTARSVNGWVKRFEAEGINGLYTRPGQGRKPIMDCSDEEAVRRAIESDRRSVRAAKQAWRNASGKKASNLTFRRFLSALAQDIDV